jgi:nitronate monooxygenase
LIPWLKSRLKIPVIAAGGISHGASMAACLALGADAVSVGTRFIACKEAAIDPAYKDAVVKASAEDIVMTTRLSGTPAAVIRTPYIDKIGVELPWIMKQLKDNRHTKKYAVPLIHWLGMRALEESVDKASWKTVWSAGQSVGLINEILSVREILEKMVHEYEVARRSLP